MHSAQRFLSATKVQPWQCGCSPVSPLSSSMRVSSRNYISRLSPASSRSPEGIDPTGTSQRQSQTPKTAIPISLQANNESPGIPLAYAYPVWVAAIPPSSRLRSASTLATFSVAVLRKSPANYGVNAPARPRQIWPGSTHPDSLARGSRAIAGHTAVTAPG